MDTPLIFLPNRTALITLLKSNELDARMVWFRGGNTGRIDGDEVCPAEQPAVTDHANAAVGCARPMHFELCAFSTLLLIGAAF